MQYNKSQNYELNSSEKIVLETIRKNDYSLRSKIVEKSNLPWTTVSTAINLLIDKQWVVGKKENGKEIIFLKQFQAYYIGISIGSSNVKVSLTAMSCEEIKDNNSNNEKFILDITKKFKQNIPNNIYCANSPINKDLSRALWCFVTPDNYVELSNLLSDICKILLQQAADMKMNIPSICFVLPGDIDVKNQTIVVSKYSNLTIKASNIESFLDNEVLNIIKKQNISLYIDHNVKASTSYELSCIAKDSNSQFYGNLAVIYLGYGLGMGITINGQLYRGENGSNLAGQFGHININRVSDNFIKSYFEKSELNNCISTQTLESAESLENILREDVLFKLVDEDYDSQKDDKEKMKRRYKETMISDLEERLLKYDSIYRKRFAYYLGTSICNVVKLLSINTFVFSGKLAALYPAFKIELQYVIMKNNCHTNINISVSKNGEFSAALGAAEMAYRNTFDIMGNLE